MFSEYIHHPKKFIVGLITISGLFGFFHLSAQAGQLVGLSWDPQGKADVIGYKIYYGTKSHSYNQVLTVGNTTSATIPGLTENTKYFFAATAFDSIGNESDFSNETTVTVSATNISVAPTMSAVTLSAGQFGFIVNGEVGRTYIVQASTDLVNWVTVQTNAAPFTFVDSETTNFTRRFYRTFTMTP
jgi:fibronectin type 3 domain-containing protein